MLASLILHEGDTSYLGARWWVLWLCLWLKPTPEPLFENTKSQLQGRTGIYVRARTGAFGWQNGD